MPPADLIVEIHGVIRYTRKDATFGGIENVLEKRVAQLAASIDEGVGAATTSVPCTYV
jgi:hypothetical protein